MALDTRVFDLIQRWEDARDRGQTLSPEELCAASPELLNEVRQRIQDLRSLPPPLQTTGYLSNTPTYGPPHALSLRARIVERFQDAWQRGQAPEIDAYLPPAEAAQRWMVLVRLARADLALRLEAGQPVRVEDYLTRFPELGEEPDVVLDLLVTEYRLRRRAEPDLAPLEYEARFPQYLATLPTRLQEAAAADSERTTQGGGPRAVPHKDGMRLPFVPGYEILGELGRGGMGVVYRAKQVGANRLVALKMILAGEHSGSQELTRFRTEIEAAARLQHPHIVQIYEVGESHGLPFFSMELVEGGRLDSRLDGRPLAPRQAARLVETLAAAVHTAHERGIVHRDLKPANILLQRKCEGHNPEGEKTDGGQGSAFQFQLADCEPKIADFGLAKRMDRGKGPTRSGTVLGTPSYMAPEQAEGRTGEVGRAADVYALGAVLYEMLTGRPPFQGQTDLDTLMQVIDAEPVPPSRLQPAVSWDVEAICLKCLRKEPRKRYPSALDLAEDLRRFREHQPVRARPLRRVERLGHWCRRNPALAAAVGVAATALVAVAALGLIMAVNAYNAAESIRHEEERTRAALLAAQARLAENYLDRALAACEREADPARGMLWLTRCLEEAPQMPAGLEATVRANLARWRSQIHPLKSAFQLPSPLAAAAFSPNGQTVLIAGEDKTARQWSIKTGQPLGPILRHRGEITALAYSPDGEVLLSGSRDMTARLWSARTGQPLTPGLQHVEAVTAVAFSPNQRAVLTVSGNQGQLWSAKTGRRLGSVLEHGGVVTAVAFSADGRTLFTSSSDRRAELWSAQTGLSLGQSLRPEEVITAAAFSPDGRNILMGSKEGTLRLWSPGKSKFARKLLRTKGPISFAGFSPGGQAIVTVSGFVTAQMWSATTGMPLGPALPGQYRIGAAAFGRSGALVLSGGPGRVGKVWLLESAEPLSRVLHHRGEVLAVTFSPDGRTALTGSSDHSAQLWSCQTGKPLSVLEHRGAIYAVAFSPDGQSVVTGSADKTARLWSAKTGRALTLTPPLKHKDAVTAVAFSPDSQTVLTGSYDETARLWSAKTGKSFTPPLRHRGVVYAVAFSPDGQVVLTCSPDKTARLWSAKTGQPKAVLRHPDAVTCAAFSPDGKTLLTGSEDAQARLWSAETGQLQGPTLQHQARVTMVAFSPDGRVVVTGSADGTARLWRAATGQPLGPALQHRGPITAVAFSRDGQAVLTGSRDKTARLWSASTGRILGPALRHEDAVTAIALSPDGRAVLTGSLDRTARLWAIMGPVRGNAEQIKAWVQVLTGREQDPHGLPSALDARLWQKRRRQLQELGGPPQP
jgi:WD40 repeat protein/serine/threonine protein kinase